MSTEIISCFDGEYRWLSNFWPSPVWFEGMEFSSVEAAYVAAKTVCHETRKHIQQLSTPGKCKRYGRKLEVRPDWDLIKVPVMASLLRQKFPEGSDLANLLLATGDAMLVEGNDWGDVFWGVCNDAGENRLGLLLMEIRAELSE